MGFLTSDPPTQTHYCQRPRAWAYPEGTRWQCNDCRKIYRIESVRDRNVSALEWVYQPPNPAVTLG